MLYNYHRTTLPMYLGSKPLIATRHSCQTAEVIWAYIHPTAVIVHWVNCEIMNYNKLQMIVVFYQFSSDVEEDCVVHVCEHDIADNNAAFIKV